MKDAVLLFKLLYRNQKANLKEAKQTGKRKLSSRAAMLMSIIPVAVLLCGASVFIGYMLPDFTAYANTLTAFLSMIQILLLFTSVFTFVNVLFNNADGAFLSALPLRPNSVFAAKFALVYINALEMSAILFIPAALALTITYNVLSQTMFYGIYPLIFLITLFAPVLPVFILSLFTMPIMWLSSFFKGRSTLKSVLTLIFYLGIMAAWLAFIYSLNKIDFGEGQGGMSGGALDALGTFSLVMYPNRTLVFACLGIDAGKNAGIFIAIILAMFSLGLLFSALFYKRIGMRQAESRPEQSKRDISYKQTNIVAALMKKDFLQVMRNPQMAMSCFANMLTTPVILVVMYFVGTFDGIFEEEYGAQIYHILVGGVAFVTGTMMLGGANMLALIAYTREGESFAVGKSLPYKPVQSIKAKLALSVSASAACLAVFVIIEAALYKLNAVAIIGSAVSTLLFSSGINAAAIYLDMKSGNVHWKTAADMKSAMSSNYSMMAFASGTMLIAGLLFGLSFAFIPVMVSLGTYAGLAIYWLIAAIISSIICAFGVLFLFKKGEAAYALIGENKPKHREPRVNFPKINKTGGSGMLK